MLAFFRSLLVLVGAAGALAACSLVPPFERPAAPLPDHYPEVAGVAADGASALPEPAAFVNDARLRALLQVALENNRDLRVAVLNVQQTEARYRVSRAELYPTVDASASATRQRQSLAATSPELTAIPGFGSGGLGGFGESAVTSNLFSASVGVTAYEIDFFGRIRSLNEEALETYFSTEEARRNAELLLIAQVATQYFTSREADEQIDLARRTLAAVGELYRLNRVMFEAGESNEQDLRAAEGQVRSAELNLLSYELQRRTSDDALALLLGTSVPTDLPEPAAFDPAALLADIPAGLPSTLAQRRPDILQAEHTLKAANADIGAARAAYFPSISLTASAGSTSTALSGLFASGSGGWSLSPQITLPIFTGGANDANLDVAKVQLAIDAANYQKTIQTAFREVADALYSMESYDKQIATGKRLVAAQERRLELATARYRQGDDSYLNVTIAQQDLYSAQQSLISARFNEIASRVSLYKALGGGWR